MGEGKASSSRIFQRLNVEQEIIWRSKRRRLEPRLPIRLQRIVILNEYLKHTA